MQYLLDTNICIAIIKNRPEKVKARLEKVSFNEVGISSIVLAELAYGVAHSRKRSKNQEALEDFLKYVEVLDWPARAATEYGNIRALLEANGTPIGAMDMLIAAHARSLGAVLVTNNEKHFNRVKGLKVENWV